MDKILLDSLLYKIFQYYVIPKYDFSLLNIVTREVLTVR